MPPTYLFGLPHFQDKQRAVLGLSEQALKFLRLTSLGFICSGVYLLSLSSALFLNFHKTSVRGSVDDYGFGFAVANAKLVSPIMIQTLGNIGTWSILVGVSSSFNYIFYTGIPNIFSAIDFGVVIVGGLNFVYQNHLLITAGYVQMVLLHMWCFLTLCVYLGRSKPSDQVYVHILGHCGLIMWYILLNTNYIFSRIPKLNPM
jgi:hypothetical protein